MKIIDQLNLEKRNLEKRRIEVRQELNLLDSEINDLIGEIAFQTCLKTAKQGEPYDIDANPCGFFGTHISDYCKLAVRIADEINNNVVFKFNGTQCCAYPGETGTAVATRYFLKRANK